MLVILTVLFVLGEFAFVIAKIYATNTNQFITTNASTLQMLNAKILWPVFQYVAMQLFLYAALVYLLWYVISTLQSGFNFTNQSKRLLTIVIFGVVITAILQANSYYVPHSFYASIITYSASLFNASMLLVAVILLATMFGITKDLLNGKFVIKHLLLISLLTFVVAASFNGRYAVQKSNMSMASAEHPNIFIIGFDALRPDALTDMPNYNNFLKNAVVFKDGYAPAARTFVSWVTILTGRYPLHHGAREDNIALNQLTLGTTLPQYLQQNGYQTVYVSDDNRFNNINHTQFGFDEISGPPGDTSDFIINYCNDFPISNLLLTTRIGKLFFPDNYANHGSPHVYEPDGFIDQFDSVLRTPHDKPLFLAAHFNITGWPFYYYRDPDDNPRTVVSVSDRQFAALLASLEKYGYLKHAIVILLSDHGVTMGEPHQRVVEEANYRGDKRNMKKLTYYRYANKDASDLGIDTSWGYGSDVLSLQQNHFLFALRGYGVEVPAHEVSGRVTLMDILPTVLAITHIPVTTKLDGISLQSYVLGKTKLTEKRPLFIESCYSNTRFIQDQALTDGTLYRLLGNFIINPVNGLVSFNEKILPKIYANKQRAIWDGDWLLANYPASVRTGAKKIGANQFTLTPVEMPPYSVLVNTKTGEWTTELNNSFAHQAPVAKLQQQLRQFYGSGAA